MQDVFEPMNNFQGEVFEPMNFSGEVFEPMNFDGEVFEPMSNFNKAKRQERRATRVAKRQAKRGGSNEQASSSNESISAESKPEPTAKKGFNVDTLKSIVGLATDTISTVSPLFQKTDFQKNLKTACGSSGQVAGVGKVKASYMECAKRFMEKQGIDNSDIDKWAKEQENQGAGTQSAPTGMSTGAKIGIAVTGLVVVGLIGFLIFKGGKKK
jgi:hypothetical protein